jgi:hypothetical protein
MLQPGRSWPRHIRHAGVLALAFGTATGGFADNGLRWRLEANVPVMCAILGVEAPADRPASLAVTTTCNAQRYQIVLHHGTEQAGLRAARSSGGQVAISGGTLTITSTRPGQALTTIELAAPVPADRLSVTLQPI